MNRLKILYRDPRRKQPWKQLGLMMIIHIAAVALMLVLQNLEWVKEHVYDSSNSRILQSIGSLPAGITYLLIAVGAPLLEESIYRLWMGLKAWTIPVFTTGGTVLLTMNFSPEIAAVLGVVVLVLSFALLPRLRHHMDIHFQWWFYGSVFLFGFQHIWNFEFSIGALPFVLPQVIIGLAIGLFRVQRGFWVGVLVHALWNGTLGLALIMPYLSSWSGQFENEDVEVEWNMGEMWTNSSRFTSSDTSLIWENVKFPSIMQWLISQAEPDAVVQVTAGTHIRMDVHVSGSHSGHEWELIDYALGELDLVIDTIQEEEWVYILSPNQDCEPVEVPREIEQVFGVLGGSSRNITLKRASFLLQQEYDCRVSTSDDVSDPVSVFLPESDRDSAFHMLARYNCIQIDSVRERVTRYIIE